MTTHVMRCIDKVGGIDNYILSKKRADRDSLVGEELRRRVETVLRTRAEKGDVEAIAKLQLAKVSGYRVRNYSESIRESLSKGESTS